MAIFRATRNDILIRVVNPFYLLSRRRRHSFFGSLERAWTSHRQHVRIVAAIRARALEESAALMAEHIGRVERYFLHLSAAQES
jgi:DNA-binding GntR family transcriptional regulator